MSEVAKSTHLLWAAWRSLDVGLVAFSEDWKSKADPKLFWGEDRLKLNELRRLAPLEYGWHGGYFGDNDGLHFILSADAVEEGPIYVAGSFNGWAAAAGKNKWKMQLEKLGGRSCYHLLVNCNEIPQDEISFFKFITRRGNWINVPEATPNLQMDGYGFHNYLLDPRRTGRHLFEVKFPLPLNQSEGRKVLFQYADDTFEETRLRPGVFLKSLQAEKKLGCWVSGGNTHFNLFAPRAHKVDLYLQDELDVSEPEPIPLELGKEMIWEVAVEGDWSGCYYYYRVTGESTEDGGFFNRDVKVVDPYAMAMVGPLGPGIILSEKDINFKGKRFSPPSWHDLVIAEAHLRDLTMDAPVQMDEEDRLGFTGLEKWVRDEAFYLKQLGVNAVELQPIHIFDEQDKNKYAWGYMPLNYFSPASQYSLDPSKASGVKEFRNVVEAFHDREMAVILDVVYNHVGEPNYFQYLDKAYYFLLTEDGFYENYSGCGNTTDANAPMFRRLMLDSLTHWIKCYDVDGFRFDLGELIGKETFSWLEKEIKKIKPGVILIAEPWSFRGHIGEALKDTGFASWNDGYRETIRAFVVGEKPASAITYFLRGSMPNWSRFPCQTVNYVDSHDDRCWIDKITEHNDFNGSWPTTTDRKRTHLMIALLMSSIGIPMVSSGVDMMKSKNGVNNTYLDGELNAIRYARALEYSGTVDYVRSWIRFRLSDAGKLLRLDSVPSEEYFHIVHEGQALAMVFNADGSKGKEQLLFAINSSFEGTSLKMPGPLLKGFRQIADTERFSPDGLMPPIYNLDDNHLTLPPLSCGLWVRDI